MVQRISTYLIQNLKIILQYTHATTAIIKTWVLFFCLLFFFFIVNILENTF